MEAKIMTRFDSRVTNAIIRKVDSLLMDEHHASEILDYLRTTEPLFMKEVDRFVETGLERIGKQIKNNDELLMDMGSSVGAAYVMGFLIAREMYHTLYEDVLDIDSILPIGKWTD
jgi:hypothetical protein